MAAARGAPDLGVGADQRRGRAAAGPCGHLNLVEKLSGRGHLYLRLYSTMRSPVLHATYGPRRRGRHRWEVERTVAWLHQFKRLRVRFDRRHDIHEAFMTLDCRLIC